MTHLPMPQNSSSPLRRTTPFPNYLLDVVMPRLSDTEFRIISAIVRATAGWRNPDGSRKTSAWLTHWQLKARTGRHSAAVSRAIEELVLKGLIDVRDRESRPLRTAADRRRSHSVLCYSLRPSVLQK